jgi:hypothetical protein
MSYHFFASIIKHDLKISPQFLTKFKISRGLLFARRDGCPESYCRDPGVGVGVTPRGKNFNLGYIF